MIIYLAGNPGTTTRIPMLVHVAKHRLISYFECQNGKGYKGVFSEFLTRLKVMRK